MHKSSVSFCIFSYVGCNKDTRKKCCAIKKQDENVVLNLIKFLLKYHFINIVKFIYFISINLFKSFCILA